MTVVLGRRSSPEEEAGDPVRGDGIRRDLTWEARRKQYHQAHTPQTYATWQPLPMPTRVAPKPLETPAVMPDPVRPGLMWLYAARMAHARTDTSSTRRNLNGSRVLVGETEDQNRQVRSIAIVGEAFRIGRGQDEHYQRLHPAIEMRYGRMRSGAMSMGTSQRVANHGAEQPVRGFASMKVAAGSLLGVVGSRPLYRRTSTSKRMMLATLTAILVIVSAATTSLAGQQRYEVRNGDTIESIANSFGVDPNAIRTSSYLPGGDVLSAGQVIIIPEPGQSPSDAAQMAAANEGSSPFVATAYWVENGDNPASIASEFGVSVDTLLQFNGIDDPLNLLPGSRVLIPVGATTVETNAAPAPAAAVDAPALGIPVPEYKQQRNLSCEYAAAYAAAMAFGWAPTEQHFIDAVPMATNPHYGYRGNIDGWWGNTEDFGVYAEPLVPVLNDWGFNAEVIYTMGDVGPLIAHLDAGHPVVTWLGFWGDTRERLTDDGNYSVFAGMHVVTVYAYDDTGVWVMDPAKGAKVHYSWDFFIQMWTVVDGMSLAIHPY